METVVQPQPFTYVAYGGVTPPVNLEADGELTISTKMKVVNGNLIPYHWEGRFTPKDSTTPLVAQGYGTTVKYNPLNPLPCNIVHSYD